MKKYLLYLQSDNGKIKLYTYATSVDTAKSQVIKAENCPERAILYCGVAPSKRQVKRTKLDLASL